MQICLNQVKGVSNFSVAIKMVAQPVIIVLVFAINSHLLLACNLALQIVKGVEQKCLSSRIRQHESNTILT